MLTFFMARWDIKEWMMSNYKEIIIPASTRYNLINRAADTANHRLNGIIKKYMEKEMLPHDKEPIEFPKKYGKRVDIIKDVCEGRPVYTLLPKGKIVSDKEIVFLHGGGGLMPPTMLHFDMAVKIVEKTQPWNESVHTNSA